MNILKSKSSQKYANKIAQHVVARKTKYFRRNVHVNHLDTNINILRIKNDDQFNLEVKGFKRVPNNLCFFFFHLPSDKPIDKYLTVKESEYIVTDSKTNQIVGLNEWKQNYPDFVNIWIIRKNTIEFLKLKIGDIFFTR